MGELAAQLEDPSLKGQSASRDLAPKERQLAKDVIMLRYGSDLTDLELEAAMVRTSCGQVVDENWFWDVSWCIGKAPLELEESDIRQAIADKGEPASSPALPAKQESIAWSVS